MKHCNHKVLYTCGPTSPMPPGVPDSPFDHEKKVAIKPQGHKKTIGKNLLASNMLPLTFDPTAPRSPFPPCRPG